MKSQHFKGLAAFLFVTMIGVPIRAESTTPLIRGWLGLQLTPVPAALASHLKLVDAGVMVTNITVDGPADAAGLQRYDVIIEADGQKVGGNVQAFSRFVQNRKPGENLELRLYRQGQTIQLSVQLGELSDDRSAQPLKYKQDPDVIAQRGFNLRGRIFRPRPDGGYDVEDLGDIPGIRDWPDFIPQLAPDEGSVTDCRHVDENGNVLHVRRLPNGEIEVKRQRANQPPSSASTRTYRDTDELRRSDREAYDLLASARQRQRDDGYQDAVNEYLRRFDFPDSGRARDWREWAERFSRRMENLPRRDRDRRSPEMKDEQLDEQYPPASQPTADQPTVERPATTAPPPSMRFDLQPDGEIRVSVRRADSEITRSYRNEAELREKSPQLYKQFRYLHDQMR